MDNKGILKNKLTKLSLLKAAGVDRIIFVEFYQSYVKFTAVKRKELFLKITKKHNGKNFEVIASESHKINSISSEVNKQFKGFIAKNKLQNAYVVAGSNDYKFKVLAIPNDVEDIDAWFFEKAAKIIPEGCTTTDFQYSYEQYYQDENNKYFYLAVVRSDLIKRIHEVCRVENTHLISIAPFPLALYKSTDEENKSTLLLDFTESKVTYSLVNTPSNVYSGEFYLQNMGEEEIDVYSFQNSVSEFYLSLLATVGDVRLQNLEIIICCKSQNIEFIEKNIRAVFKPESINSRYQEVDPYYCGAYLSFDKIIVDFSTQINFLNTDHASQERFLLEKNVSMRMILAIGLILMIFLAVCSLGESYITTQFSGEEEEILAANTTTAQLESLQKEKARNEANLSLLHSIKNKRSQYTNLIYQMSKVITDKSWLTSIDAKSIDINKIEYEIKGKAYSQQEIAAIISNLEHTQSMQEVTLLYSSENDISEDRSSEIDNTNTIQFSISAKYDLNKK